MHSSRRNNLQLLTRKSASFCGESACKTAVSTVSSAQQVSWLDNSEALFRPVQGALCSQGGAFCVINISRAENIVCFGEPFRTLDNFIKSSDYQVV